MDTRQQYSFSENEIVTLRVIAADTGSRLDTYLATHIEGWSRARLQQLIETPARG